MKQGSADDPFAEEPADNTTDSTASTGDGLASDATSEMSEDATSGGGDDATVTIEKDTTASSRERSLPYIHARNGVKDGRTQRPVFLREHVEEGIEDLVDEMEATFDERVYKTDVTEAAMVIAQENPDLVRATLEEWGYGWS